MHRMLKRYLFKRMVRKAIKRTSQAIPQESEDTRKSTRLNQPKETREELGLEVPSLREDGSREKLSEEDLQKLAKEHEKFPDKLASHLSEKIGALHGLDKMQIGKDSDDESEDYEHVHSEDIDMHNYDITEEEEPQEPVEVQVLQKREDSGRLAAVTKNVVMNIQLPTLAEIVRKYSPDLHKHVTEVGVKIVEIYQNLAEIDIQPTEQEGYMIYNYMIKRGQIEVEHAVPLIVGYRTRDMETEVSDIKALKKLVTEFTSIEKSLRGRVKEIGEKTEIMYKISKDLHDYSKKVIPPILPESGVEIPVSANRGTRTILAGGSSSKSIMDLILPNTGAAAQVQTVKRAPYTAPLVFLTDQMTKDKVSEVMKFARSEKRSNDAFVPDLLQALGLQESVLKEIHREENTAIEILADICKDDPEGILSGFLEGKASLIKTRKKVLEKAINVGKTKSQPKPSSSINLGKN
uniref:Protein 2 n=1 Tax=Spinach virus 1_Ole TaxID=2977990 RepID=A0A9N6YJ42_9RHAB|nr:TPA_asm: protein 2 [Spinach virus 1_Ole]